MPTTVNSKVHKRWEGSRRLPAETVMQKLVQYRPSQHLFHKLLLLFGMTRTFSPCFHTEIFGVLIHRFPTSNKSVQNTLLPTHHVSQWGLCT